MSNSNIKYVGMDVHKDSISIAIADEGRTGEIRSYGTIVNTLNSLDKFVRKQVSKGYKLHFAYEAGPTGFGIFRHLTGNGIDCIVVAPSKVPHKSGDRIKNDRRDAHSLARCHRAGDLEALYIPTAEDEAMRDLIRCREDSIRAIRKAKQRLLAFLLRHAIRYSAKTNWTKAHFNWLSDLKMTHPAQQIALQEYINSINESKDRVARLTKQITDHVKEWRHESLVKALQSLRGISLLTAATLVAELGPLERFSNPRHLMGFLGLVPTEYSSGDSVKRGGITKTGNGFARKALVESSWTYRFPARTSRHLLKRSQELPEPIRKTAWKAQVRLCGRFRSLSAKGKPKQVVATAIARELAGFIWAISRQVNLSTT